MNSLARNALITGGAGVGAALLGQALLRRRRWFTFAGKTVLVTGGSRGLGLVIARQLVAAKARVAICARDEDELVSAAWDLRFRGGDVQAIRCDVREPEQVQAMVELVRDRFGPVDVLFNVAGVIEVGPVEAMSLDDFHDAMATHCFGPLHTTMAVLPDMKRRGWGRIVNISSIGGKVAPPHLLPYVASKFALVGLSNGLRAELAPDGILVTTVNPGLMRTGSPRNATFKGQHRAEYAWFSVSDSLPVISIDAESAARRIIRACQRGDAEVVITAVAKLVATMQALAPNLMIEVMSVVDRLLPGMGGIGGGAAKGRQSQSAVSPSWLTALTEKAARRNNELAAK
ncbi:MAG: SDR family NAD(P)-dependent oxidoreductase [Gemmataceae bacterium]